MSTDETRDAILDAAERLFSEHGFDGTSIREMTRAAGVNVAAVHYHFGTKEAVLRAVTDRVVEPLNAQRFALLDAAVRHAQGDPGVSAILEAFLRPDVETIQRFGRRGPAVARFLGRTYSDQTPWIQAMALEQFMAAESRFFPALARALPHLSLDDIRWRLQRVVAVIIHIFATWPDRPRSDVEADELVRDLVEFLTPALAAPRRKQEDEHDEEEVPA